MADILPVGILEIAEKLGVKRATVDQWLQRDLLPAPDWTVGGRPAWNWPAIRRWAIKTGRHQEEPVITIADLTTALGLPATKRETVARFAGAFTAPEVYAKTGRIAPRWAGQGMDAAFTEDEAGELENEWRRAAAHTDGVSYLTYGQDPEVEEIADRYRP